MNLNYLKTFSEIIKLGSFSEAAKVLSISQPAVSFQVRKLESELGVTLIDRSQKVITITEAGRRLLSFVEYVEKERYKLMQDLDILRDEVIGDLVIVASTIPGEFILPSVLGSFKAANPSIRAQVMVSDSMDVISGVVGGGYDVGFCGMALEGQVLESFKMMEDEIVLIVFPEHPFAGCGEVPIRKLEGQSFIFREESSGTQKNVETNLVRAGFDLNHWMPNLVMGTTQAVISAVEAGAGIAFVSSLAIGKGLALGTIKQVSVEGLKMKRNFHCIYRKERVVSRLLKEFLAFVRNYSV